MGLAERRWRTRRKVLASVNITKSRSVLGASFIALVALAGIATGCSDGHAAPEEGAVPVKATTLTLATVEEYSDYLATVRSRRSIEIRPQVEGYVSRLSVKPGNTVADGALLVQIDPKRQQATTTSAVAASGIAAAEVDRGKATLAQLEAAREGRVAALKLAEEDHRRAMADQSRAQSASRPRIKRPRRSRVRTPISPPPSDRLLRNMPASRAPRRACSKPRPPRKRRR